MSSGQHPESSSNSAEGPAPELDQSDAEVAERKLTLRDRIVPLSALGAIVVLLVVLGITLYSPSSSSLGAGGRVNTSGNAVEVDNQEAPDFTLQTFDGEEVSLSDFRGKSVVINFWASWCPPCRDEAPMLNAFHEEAERSDDMVLLGIAIWDQEEDSRQFMEEYNLSFTNLSDERGSVLIDYGVYGIPETYFIDADGMLIGKYRGPLESDEHIQELMDRFEQG